MLFLLSLSVIVTIISIGLNFNTEQYNGIRPTSGRGRFWWLEILLLGITLLNLFIVIFLISGKSLPLKDKKGLKVPLQGRTQKPNAEHEIDWRAMAKQIAHEIKNPLTPLKLGVQLLEKSWRDKDPNFSKKFEKFSQSFIEQIESLSLIASEFSNFAKMPDITFEDVNLKEVIRGAIDIYEKLPELSITFKDKTEVPVYIKANTEQLLRIFNSLIKNAIEAIPDYRKGIIEIILERADERAKIQIKDNGNGIHPDLHGIIFRPNFTTKSSGTGLGLAFVKQAVENMMGKVDFETQQNTGTTFYISIPIAS